MLIGEKKPTNMINLGVAQDLFNSLKDATETDREIRAIKLLTPL